MPDQLPLKSSFALLISLALLSVVVTAIALPTTCNARGFPAPNATTLHSVRTTTISVPNHPFGLVYATKQQHIAFATLDNSPNGSTLGVLNTSNFTPTLIHQIALPAPYVDFEGALGVALTHDGRHVLVAAGPGLIVVNAARAVAGRSDAVVGAVNGTVGNVTAGDAAIEVTVSKDDRYAFVSQEYGPVLGRTPGNVQVFELHKSRHNVTGKSVGYLSLGFEVVGTALSPKHPRLYAVSESTVANASTPGFISVIDTITLRSDPSAALLSNASAACGPVREIVSSDGKVVWVTARESNLLIAFDVAKLVSDPSNAVLAAVEVGTAPVGLTFAAKGTRILTADSNRFGFTNATTSLTVVDTRAALEGKPAVLGRIPTGLFPREFAVSPDGKFILVADYTSGQIQMLDVSTLP